jgi:hypothetical protein
MKILIRMVGFTALVAFGAIWLWACVAGFAYAMGTGWTLLAVAMLLWLRFFVPLQLAALFGAIAVWHLPVVPSLLLAAPRPFLMLPGMVATFLASRRHPRARWSI